MIGPGGSGKSYFSKKLSKILDIPVYHLDEILHNWLSILENKYPVFWTLWT